MTAPSREIYISSNGDRWLLAEHDGKIVVRHVPNASSGGASSHIDVDAFLSRDRGSPQQQALLELIATLVPDEKSAPAV